MEMNRNMQIMRVLLSVGIIFKGCYSDVTCRNDAGEAVDWYILYKLPKAIDAAEGLSYFYMDESSNGWEFSEKTINSKTGSLANTLRPLHDYYERKTERFGYILYSDQPPHQSSVSSSYGHSKGVVMLDRQNGLWLSHSTPKFPEPSKDFWPTNGNANAQTFVCVTFPYHQFKDIGEQLKYIHAYSYDSHIPPYFPKELDCVAQRYNCYPKKEPWFRVIKLNSTAGRNFVSFAKYGRFEKDLYSDLIADHVSEDLYVKSWGKMRNPLSPTCNSSGPRVLDILKVKFKGTGVFENTVDHSKWCVTRDGGWTCIADMNRETSQKSRGGGAICTDDAGVGKAFTKLISVHEECEAPHSNILNREL